MIRKLLAGAGAGAAVALFAAPALGQVVSTPGQIPTIGSGLTYSGTTLSVTNPSPATSVLNDLITFSNTTGALQDSGVTVGSLAPLISPSFTTPNLGTPSAGVLTNATGLPVSTGISGLGTGVATALGAAVSGTGAICLASGSACAASGGFVAPTAISGHWYMPPFVTIAVGSAATATRMTCQQQVNFAPAYTVKALGFRITTLGTSYTQVAIYANSAGKPNGAALGYTSGTDGVNTSPALISGPLTDSGASGSNFTLPTGVYWACAVSNDSLAVLDTVSASVSVTAAFTGSATQGSVNAGSTTAGFAVYQSITCNATAATGCTFPTASSSGWSEAATQAQGGFVMNQAN